MLGDPVSQHRDTLQAPWVHRGPFFLSPPKNYVYSFIYVISRCVTGCKAAPSFALCLRHRTACGSFALCWPEPRVSGSPPAPWAPPGLPPLSPALPRPAEQGLGTARDSASHQLAGSGPLLGTAVPKSLEKKNLNVYEKNE